MYLNKTGAVVALEDKALQESDACWTATGYAAVFNNRDQGNDVILPGAFKQSLAEHGLPLILFQHKHDDVPVGTCVDAREDRKGLWLKIELPRDDTFVSGRLVPQLKRRGLKGMSIGYRVNPGGAEKRQSDGARLLKSLRLFEASFVSMPMNPQAGLESISKSENLDELLHELRTVTKRLNTVLHRDDPAQQLIDVTKEFIAELHNFGKPADAATDLIRLMKQFAAEARDMKHLELFEMGIASDPIARAEAAFERLYRGLSRRLGS